MSRGSTTVNEWLDKFHDHLKIKNYSQDTLKNYLFYLKHFFLYLGENGIHDIASVTKDTIRHYQIHLYEKLNRNGSPDTVASQNVALRAIKSFFRFLTEEDYLVADPARGVFYAKEENRVKSWSLLFPSPFAIRFAMSRPLRIDYPHAYYHVTSRGNERRAIFKDDHDRSAFLEKLQSSLAIYGVRLHCYVLMDNHFHLVVETPKANLSEFMRHFNVSYSGFYNRRHRRVGHLYQGRFKAVLVEADSYLLELSRYVHLNPVRVGALGDKAARQRLKYLERYRWSSLEGYLGHGKRKPWVVYDQVLSYVGGSRRRYGQFVEEGVRRGYATPWEELKGQVILGGEGFWERVKGKWLRREGARKDKERPSLGLLEKIGPEEALRRVAGYFKLRPQELIKKRSGYRDQRGLAMEVMYRFCGLKQREIGRELGGIGYTQVSHERGRIREKVERDSEVKRWSREVDALLIAKTKI